MPSQCAKCPVDFNTSRLIKAFQPFSPESSKPRTDTSIISQVVERSRDPAAFPLFPSTVSAFHRMSLKLQYCSIGGPEFLLMPSLIIDFAKTTHKRFWM